MWKNVCHIDRTHQHWHWWSPSLLPKTKTNKQNKNRKQKTTTKTQQKTKCLFLHIKEQVGNTLSPSLIFRENTARKKRRKRKKGKPVHARDKHMNKERGISKCGQSWIPANGRASVLGVSYSGPRNFGVGHTSVFSYRQCWAQFVQPQSEIHHFQEVQCALGLVGQATDFIIWERDFPGQAVAWGVCPQHEDLAQVLATAPILLCALRVVYLSALPEDQGMWTVDLCGPWNERCPAECSGILHFHPRELRKCKITPHWANDKTIIFHSLKL